MKKYLLVILLLIKILSGHGQEQHTIKFGIEQIESLFLANNLELIAAKYSINIADAAISQAKLWDNPTLSVSGVNLWTTKYQRQEIKDMSSSSFIPNTEYSIELSQLIQTANKRGKLVKREKIAKEIAVQEFEELLRGLKTELRKSAYEMIYMQNYLQILINQQKNLDQLIESHKKQVQQGNIAKNELIRLQSSFLEVENELNEAQSELNDKEKTLKILLGIPPGVNVEITDDGKDTKNPDLISLASLLDMAEEQRPDLQLYKIQTEYHKKSLTYEKSLKIPDLTLSAAYDRYGGVWKDFIGIGISIDLPFFNRNQGNIKSAKLSLDQSYYLVQQQQNTIRHEIATQYKNYTYAYSFLKKINDENLMPELDNMLDAYTRNLLNRNISMVEYMDFMESYKNNKHTILNARKKVCIQFEELQFSIGKDIK